MSRLLLDSGGLSRLSRAHQRTAALIRVFERDGIWPPVVPSVVLAESLSGRQRTDAAVNRFLKACIIVEEVPEALARRAGALRARARCGSAVDALVVAMAEPGGTVLTGDIEDFSALAHYADDVRVHAA